MQVPDAVVDHYARLLDASGIMTLINAELGRRPGPAGLPIRAVLICLLVSIHYTGKATLSEAWRLAAFSLTATARDHLELEADPVDADDPHACLASSRRFYRAFDRLTSLLDPARHDRRARLPQPDADQLATTWEDTDPEHTRLRDLLQNIVTALVLTPVKWAKGRGYLAGFQGDVGIDTTAVPVFARPPRVRRSTGELVASTEITAGWHHSAGKTEPEFGYSATLTVAARTTTAVATAAVTATFPQLALGLVLDTPHKRIGQTALATLHPLTRLDLPARFAVVDRAYTDQQPDHFARPVRALGYKLALDYKLLNRGVQGSVHGTLLVDGTLACPLMPDRLAHATTGLDDDAIRAPSEELATAIAAREPYFLQLKQSPNASGAVRLQCPAAGTSPSVSCARFDRLHQREPGRPAAVDLSDARRRAAHPSAKPRVLTPFPDLPADQQPKICRQQSITLHPADLGHLDKFRQDLPYLSPTWKRTYGSARAQTEGLNGRLKGFALDLGEPKNRLAHGRVAQSILAALIVTVANDDFLDQWRHTHQPEHIAIQPPDITADLPDQRPSEPPTPNGTSPPRT
ncbi:hypothetical protein DMB42_20160 [Nonomuraea sp. WAC 01424]|uniref:hypothetical protein n=1 Tax=Nonomuraea sp. WAC 01424 TaxID=2203200 RepID=UPI000F7A2B08|nr:hypothetical protein [Nonomuraea sp. WAC 01424]RSN08361.1 hypothetical protein DMB42_20160 [Nonomuraea sp. WAC 01424]